MAVFRPEDRSDGVGSDDDDLIGPSGADALDPLVAAEVTTDAIAGIAEDGEAGWLTRVFGSTDFFRLWLAQVVQAMGDWVGLLAISFLAGEVGGGQGSAAIGLVITARVLPGLFLAPMAGVMVDRWDRKKVLVICNLGRAGVVVLLPFVGSLAWLVVAALALETMTLLWGPAKEATVPNLVPRDHLTTANSLGLAAAYGTFPLASVVFALLATVSGLLAGLGSFEFLRTDQVAIAFYFQALAFIGSAWLISRLAIPRRERSSDEKGWGRIDWASTIRELKEGWHYIFINPTVRAVNIGLATGLIGGGMLIPLGVVYSGDVLNAGAAGYGFFMTALGFGVATGVVGISIVQRRVNQKVFFSSALLVAGAALFGAASSSTIGVSVAFVFVMGVAVGPVYVLGYATLQSEVDDELRGRVFGALNTLVRLCLIVSMSVGPLLATLLGRSDDATNPRTLDVAGVSLALPGVRLTLWIASLIIIAAGLMARQALKSGDRRRDAVIADHPARRQRP